MLPAERGLVSTGACVCTRVCVHVHGVRVCLHMYVCMLCLCVDAHSCVRERPWGRGSKQGGISIYPLFKGTPAPLGRPSLLDCPPGLAVMQVPPGMRLSLREAETTGSLPALSGFAHFHCKYFCSKPKEATLGTHHSYNGGILSLSPPGP